MDPAMPGRDRPLAYGLSTQGVPARTSWALSMKAIAKTARESRDSFFITSFPFELGDVQSAPAMPPADGETLAVKS